MGVSVSWSLFLQLLVNGLILGSTYAAMAVSFGIIYATSRTFHLAHSVTYAVSGYVMVTLVVRLDVPLVVGGVIGIIGAIIFGVVVDRLLYKPLRDHNAPTLGIFLASLAIVMAGQNLIQVIWGPEQQSLKSLSVKTLSAGPVSVTSMQLIAMGVCIVSIAAIAVFISKSRMGHAITAYRTNSETAVALGISAPMVMGVVFAIGSALAGIVAFFDASVYTASSTMGMAPVLYGFIGLFVGGINSILGATVGGFAIALLLSLSGLVFSQNIGVVLVFALLLVVLVVRPEGLVGKRA